MKKTVKYQRVSENICKIMEWNKTKKAYIARKNGLMYYAYTIGKRGENQISKSFKTKKEAAVWIEEIKKQKKLTQKQQEKYIEYKQKQMINNILADVEARISNELFNRMREKIKIATESSKKLNSLVYSPAEAAKTLGVSTRTIYRLIRENKLKFKKIGILYKIPKEEIAARFL